MPTAWAGLAECIATQSGQSSEPDSDAATRTWPFPCGEVTCSMLCVCAVWTIRPRKTARTPSHFLAVKGKAMATEAFELRRLLVTTFPV